MKWSDITEEHDEAHAEVEGIQGRIYCPLDGSVPHLVEEFDIGRRRHTFTPDTPVVLLP